MNIGLDNFYLWWLLVKIKDVILHIVRPVIWRHWQQQVKSCVGSQPEEEVDQELQIRVSVTWTWSKISTTLVRWKLLVLSTLRINYCLYVSTGSFSVSQIDIVLIFTWTRTVDSFQGSTKLYLCVFQKVHVEEKRLRQVARIKQDFFFYLPISPLQVSTLILSFMQKWKIIRKENANRICVSKAAILPFWLDDYFTELIHFWVDINRITL